MPRVTTGRPKAKAEEKKNRENKGSGEEGLGVKEDRVERRGIGRRVVESHNNSLKAILYQTLPRGGGTAQKRLRPCLFVH